jgi:hypothetical protein
MPNDSTTPLPRPLEPIASSASRALEALRRDFPVPDDAACMEPRRDRRSKVLDWSRIRLVLAALYVCFGSSPASLILNCVKNCRKTNIINDLWETIAHERPGKRRVLSSALIGTLILTLGAGVGTVGQQTATRWRGGCDVGADAADRCLFRLPAVRGEARQAGAGRLRRDWPAAAPRIAA